MEFSRTGFVSTAQCDLFGKSPLVSFQRWSFNSYKKPSARRLGRFSWIPRWIYHPLDSNGKMKGAAWGIPRNLKMWCHPGRFGDERLHLGGYTVVKVDGATPQNQKVSSFVRCHDKPRLLGVASHLLSRWYISNLHIICWDLCPIQRVVWVYFWSFPLSKGMLNGTQCRPQCGNWKGWSTCIWFVCFVVVWGDIAYLIIFIYNIYIS